MRAQMSAISGHGTGSLVIFSELGILKVCCSWKASTEDEQRNNSTTRFIYKTTKGMAYNIGKRHRSVLSEPALEDASVTLINK